MDIFRIFKKTTERTSHVGQAGYDTSENWERFFAKYKDSCVVFLETKYPQWKADAEDVFMMAVGEIRRDPRIINRSPDASFRSVLANICRKFMWRLHNPHRETAVRRFVGWLRTLAQPGSRTWNPEVMRKIKDIIHFIRNDLLRPDYENGRFFSRLNKRQLDLWRLAQLSDLSDTDLAIQLGVSYKELNRAKNAIDRRIIEESAKIAREHGLVG